MIENKGEKAMKIIKKIIFLCGRHYRIIMLAALCLAMIASMLEKASPYDCLGDYLNACSNVAEK